MRENDWIRWHNGYDDPTSQLARRLVVVRERIRLLLDECPPGPVRVLSVCAGQGRDLLGVLKTHPRRLDVTARLVELDPHNAGAARRAAESGGLSRVEVRVGDAALVDQYAGLAPADLVLMCGVFGNIGDEDVERAVGYCAQLCRTGGHVVWTRHRRVPDLVPEICRWYERHGFTSRWLSDPVHGFGVGVHRYDGQPQPLASGESMFTCQ